MTRAKYGPGYDVDPSWYCGAEHASGPCLQRAGWGTDHVGTGRCKLDGGCTPTHVKAGQRQRAAVAVATYGLPREVEPAQALLEEVHRSAGHVAWLAALVAELDRSELKQLDTSERFEKPSVWVELYQSERAHLARVAKDAILAGVAERQVRLAEQYGALMADLIRGSFEEVLAGLSLDGATVTLAWQLVAEVVPRRLRALTAGSAA